MIVHIFHHFIKVETILDLWKDQKNGAIGDRNDLLQYLKKHQKAHSCQDLIHRLESIPSGGKLFVTKV